MYYPIPPYDPSRPPPTAWDALWPLAVVGGILSLILLRI